MDEIHGYALDFFSGLLAIEQVVILEAALKQMGKQKVGAFKDDQELKRHLFLLERIRKFLKDEDYGGYDCDIATCDRPAKFYNSNIDAFYCLEHN